jgi:hypothetical protein
MGLQQHCGRSRISAFCEGPVGSVAMLDASCQKQAALQLWR